MLRLVHDREIGGPADLDQAAIKRAHARRIAVRKAEGDFQRIILEQVQQRRMMQQRNETIRERNQRLKQQRN
mgnify:CR=1 FL=1